jgi:hypothetical protein
MPQQQYVVQYSNQADLFMIHYDPDFNLCRWASNEHPNVMTWNTLAAAQAVAVSINNGTIGMPRPPKGV